MTTTSNYATTSEVTSDATNCWNTPYPRVDDLYRCLSIYMNDEDVRNQEQDLRTEAQMFAGLLIKSIVNDRSLSFFITGDVEDNSIEVGIDKGQATRRVVVVFRKGCKPYAWLLDAPNSKKLEINPEYDYKTIVDWVRSE